MEFRLSDTELTKLADMLAAKMIPSEKPQRSAGLEDWIRADDLYSKNLFSKTTLNSLFMRLRFCVA